MKCLIFSDSHGDSSLIYRAIAQHRDAEVIFFLGDGLSDIADLKLERPDAAVIAVRGNCDFRSEFMGVAVNKTATLELMGRKILLTHGDSYNVKYGTALAEKLAEDAGADILLFGHTHEKLCKYVNVEEKYADAPAYREKLAGMSNYYLFNPGSAKGYGGSYGILTITENCVLFSHGN